MTGTRERVHAALAAYWEVKKAKGASKHKYRTLLRAIKKWQRERDGQRTD